FFLFCFCTHPAPSLPLFPYTTLFRSPPSGRHGAGLCADVYRLVCVADRALSPAHDGDVRRPRGRAAAARRGLPPGPAAAVPCHSDRKSTRLTSSHAAISTAAFCLTTK